MRLKAAVLAALAALVVAAAAAPAQSEAQSRLYLFVKSSKTGVLGFYVKGPAGVTVRVHELIGRRHSRRSTLVLDEGSRAGIENGDRWRCDRLVRNYTATAVDPPGAAAPYSVRLRTPSCSNRLTLSLPRQAAPGGEVVANVSDSWGIGAIRPRLCLVPPFGGMPRCDRFAVSARTPEVERKLQVPLTRGRWVVELRGPSQRLRAPLYVGVPAPPPPPPRPRVVVAGDSMMQALSGFLSDRVGNRARVIGSVHPGTGISKPPPFGVTWNEYALRASAEQKPTATAMFVGANEGYDMTSPEGTRSQCCGEEWIAEYARRAGEIMRAYGTTGRVVWLLLPAPRNPERTAIFAAVNQAFRRAAAGIPGVVLVDLPAVFTPDFKYRSRMRVNGRLVTVREQDGIHLSLKGARIAAPLVVRALGLRKR